MVLWHLLVRPRDLALPAAQTDSNQPAESFFKSVLGNRRFWILLVVVISINSTWHFFRVWLPRLLQRTHGYSEHEMQLFTYAYNLSAGIGSLVAGCATVWLVRRGHTRC